MPKSSSRGNRRVNRVRLLTAMANAVVDLAVFDIAVTSCGKRRYTKLRISRAQNHTVILFRHKRRLARSQTRTRANAW